MSQNKMYGWVKIFIGWPTSVDDTHSGRLWTVLKDQMSSVSGTTEESVFMKLHLKRASGVERSGTRMPKAPTKTSYSDVIKELVGRWTKFVEKQGDCTGN
jgi:hypothetical protein